MEIAYITITKVQKCKHGDVFSSNLEMTVLDF